MTENIGVICTGRWGTAIAETLATSNARVLSFEKEKSVVKEINKNQTNSKYSGTHELHENFKATHSLKDVLKTSKILFLTAPTEVYEELLTPVKKFITKDHVWVICSKGLNTVTGDIPSEVLKKILGYEPKFIVLSGPLNAQELLNQKPCAITLHTENSDLLENIKPLLDLSFIRLYYGSDVIGCQLCGAMRNIIAIACGMADALDLGEGARSAIVTRGMAEMERYVAAFGGQAETAKGLSGIGDLILASTSKSSRYYRFGVLLGQEMPTHEAYNIEHSFIESTKTCNIILSNAIAKGIDLAIIAIVDGVLNVDLPPKRAFDMLLNRPVGYE